MTYRCSSCNYHSGKWMGFCPSCGDDTPLLEGPDRSRTAGVAANPIPLGSIGDGNEPRSQIGIGELDRVLGGGLVRGSVVLLGGEPGIGKSTLLLQAAAASARQGRQTLVATAEESAEQVGLRARRLGLTDGHEADRVLLLPDDDLDRIIATAVEVRPDLLVIDSIQTVNSRDADGGQGGPAQIRECGSRLLRLAKQQQLAVMLIGHVNKDGNLAGPKLLEHMVDVVLSFEGDPDHGLRVLRTLKNRFGPTHLVGMFEMNGEGLKEVADPSRTFLADWRGEVPGTVVFPAVEGRRSITVEVQALANVTVISPPRRSVRGVDQNRVHQLLAVLGRHGGLRPSQMDVYVNVVGGWRIDEPACDLPVALAIASSFLEVPLGGVAAWGEIGLAGEVRQVPFRLRREEEALRVGVERVIAPSPDQRLDVPTALLAAGLW
ncbi:MAG: DNA repair protein RadA [Actinomycetota bacterium]